ncbi:uncharacterized protein LOC134838875 [Symsagittifera roscoffensis]|uniref:uncharacterized protein LOC134838875 n=1 Tax=Symsagittifera roscoffensis TaxID=84072 RepID=UPI00307C9587
MDYQNLLPLFSNNELAINFLKQKNLLKNSCLCTACQTPQNWTKYQKTKDGFSWRCQNRTCSRFKLTTSIRKDSFFENSNIDLPKWIQIIYLWGMRGSNKNAATQVGVSQRAIVDAFASLREICQRHLLANPIQLGGPGIVLEIDESCFSHKPKHHRGRIPQQPIWVFGIVDTSYKPAIGYMEIVEQRNAATLLPIIQSVARPGSIIHSDEWRAYRGIQGMGFAHKTVNHSVNFVEPDGTHTQTVESYWNRKKTLIKSMLGCRRIFLHYYLQEFMWRDRFGSRAFENIILHMNNFYSL